MNQLCMDVRRATLMGGLLACLAWPLNAAELNEQFAVEAVFKGIYQYGKFELNGESDELEGDLITLDLAFAFTPSSQDSFNALFRWGVDDGLNQHWPGGLAPFSHHGESDLENINGSDRDYLLTAYYTRALEWSGHNEAAFSLGLLDSVEWLDHNAYAGDELSQFMNDALVNNSVLHLPAYDPGAALALQSGNWSLNSVLFRSKSDDQAERHYEYYGLQLGWLAHTPHGQGNYRLILYRTSADLLTPQGDFAALSGWGLSVDQSFGQWGAFARYGQQSEDAQVDYRTSASLGLSLDGGLWGRGGDQAGIGYAWLDGGNSEIDGGQVWEAYVNFALNTHLSLSFDLQYMTEDRRGEGEKDTAWIPGLRLTASF